MKAPNLSDYERRRAEDHEFFWRMAAGLSTIPSGFCRFRQCYRLRECCGPMSPSDHQLGQIRTQQEIGLSGKACATLPRCVAHIPEKNYADLRKLVESLMNMRSKHSDIEISHVVGIWMRESRTAPPKPGSRTS